MKFGSVQASTLRKYRKFDELYLHPKLTIVADMSGVNRTALNSFLKQRSELSHNSIILLNKFLDEQLDKMKSTN